MTALPKIWKRIRPALENQGCVFVEKHDGFMIRCPGGVEQITIHSTESDRRALGNTRSRIRRAGLTWPLD